MLNDISAARCSSLCQYLFISVSTYNLLVNKILFIHFVLICCTSTCFEYYLLIIMKAVCIDYILLISDTYI
jgi:hypothetical protein